VRIRSDLTKARRTVAAIRGLCGVLAGFAAIPTWFLWEIVMVEDGAWPFFLVSLGSMLALIAGALFAHLNPLAWTIGLACLWTLSALADLFTGGIPVVASLLAIALWAVVPMMLKVHRMMRDHPDLVDTSKLKHRERREGVEVSETLARSRQRERRRSQSGLRAFATVAGIVLALLGGVWAVVAMTGGGDDRGSTGVGYAPPAAPTPEELARADAMFPDRLVEFRRSWEQTDLPSIEGMFNRDRQIAFWPKVVRLLERREWQDDLPDIGEPELFDYGRTTKGAFFPISPKGTLKTRWNYEQGAWRLDMLVFADTR
jgi:hypothetical protein